MRDQNRIREKFQLSLDGRQVTTVVVGAMLVLAAVFVLGMNVGKQLARREPPAAARPADPLAALDAPPPVSDAGEPPPRLSYHEALTRPAEPVAPPPRAEEPAAAAPAPAAAPAAPPAAARPPPAPSAPASPSAPVAARGAFTIQVGAAQDPAEAERLAEKLRRHRSRVEAADIPGKGRWYRVRLGDFGTREEAERYLRDLARETGAKGFVVAGDS